jgi:hypothetical protein
VQDWIRDHSRLLTAWLSDPIGMAVFEIRTHTHEIAHEFDTLRHDTMAHLDEIRHDVARWADDVPHDIARAWDRVRHDAAALGDWLVHEVESKFDKARHSAARGADDARHDVASAWDHMRHDVAAKIDDLLHDVEKLPGETVRELEKLPGELEHAGESAIDGLIRGIEHEAEKIPSLMKGLASDVESYFTDPLKIFSPSRVMFEHGRMVPEGVALGIEAGVPRIRQASGRMTQAVSLGGPGHTGYGAAGQQPVRIEFDFGPSMPPPVRAWLKKSIRITGGNASVVGR